jgi:ABC transport system ATP-binding/permease protein
MAFINIQNVGLAFGGAPLFENINLTVEQGEKLALVGRNGSGKSSLLKLIAGIIRPDAGAVAIQKGIRSAYLDQMVPGEMPGTVLEVVEGELSRTQDNSETEGGWGPRQQARKVTSQLGLDANRVFNTLSAGLKRQVLLAKALAGGPDILLLDEPTNHMDIDSIQLLEDMLLRYTGALILVTHDRIFLQRIATRIVEIDRGRLFDQSCDYGTFIVRREAAREVE